MRPLSRFVVVLALLPPAVWADAWQKHMQAGRKAFTAFRFSDAERHFGEAMREAAKSGPEGVRLADSLDGMAEVYIAESKFSLAEPLMEKSLGIRQKAPGSRILDLAKSIDSLADVYEKDGKRAKAEPLYAQAKSLREKALAEHPDIYTIVDGKLIRRDPK